MVTAPDRKLKGRRAEQLQLLKAAGAVSRETAVAVGFDHDYRPGTLSRMVQEGLACQAQLPFKGDGRRRVSHYWLTEAGAQLA